MTALDVFGLHIIEKTLNGVVFGDGHERLIAPHAALREDIPVPADDNALRIAYDNWCSSWGVVLASEAPEPNTEKASSNNIVLPISLNDMAWVSIPACKCNKGSRFQHKLFVQELFGNTYVFSTDGKRAHGVKIATESIPSGSYALTSLLGKCTSVIPLDWDPPKFSRVIPDWSQSTPVYEDDIGADFDVRYPIFVIKLGKESLLNMRYVKDLGKGLWQVYPFGETKATVLTCENKLAAIMPILMPFKGGK
jgi:hypothetical protein